MSEPRLRYGLVGERLSHSHSPALHALLAPYPYALYEMPPDDLAAFIRAPGLGGLNVTIPYKQAVLPLCDALTPRARRIGSVNTLLYGPDGRITGDNTDYDGLRAMLERAGICVTGRKVVILGSGGTARTACAVCEDAGARAVITISRTGTNNYDNLGLHADAQVLINATPVGMHPHPDGMPVSLDAFPALLGVADAIYNPLRTRLVQVARARGIPAAGGLAMLVWQAAGAAERFTGAPIAAEKAEAALQSLRRSVENIVLIGMPGCGKTTVGRAVAALSGRAFVDTDEEVVRQVGKTIPRIFAEDGEAAFRAAEGRVVAEAAGRSGCVIATGGGTVLAAENRAALARNGRIVFLRRPLARLAVAGRPLSVDIEALAAARLPVYAAAADYAVDNDSAIGDAAERVWEGFLRCGYA